jgi:hypothetical protein
MIDYLVSFAQCLCLLGYGYGAWLVITHKADAGDARGREAVSRASAGRPEDNMVTHRYIAYDW